MNLRPFLRALTCGFLVLSASFSSRLVSAQDLEGAEAGLALAVQLRTMEPEANSQWRGSLNIKPKGGEIEIIPISCQVVVAADQWKVIYTTTGTPKRTAERLTVIHSTNGPSQFWLARSSGPSEPLGKPEMVAGTALDVPFAGSDFWLSELGFDFYHWPVQNRLKGAMRRGQPCYVLESANPMAKPGGLARVVTYLERESGQPILAEAEGTDKKTLKEFSLGKMAKVNGRWTPKNLEISNRKTGSHTWLEFDVEPEK